MFAIPPTPELLCRSQLGSIASFRPAIQGSTPNKPTRDAVRIVLRGKAIIYELEVSIKLILASGMFILYVFQHESMEWLGRRTILAFTGVVE